MRKQFFFIIWVNWPKKSSHTFKKVQIRLTFPDYKHILPMWPAAKMPSYFFIFCGNFTSLTCNNIWQLQSVSTANAKVLARSMTANNLKKDIWLILVCASVWPHHLSAAWSQHAQTQKLNIRANYWCACKITTDVRVKSLSADGRSITLDSIRTKNSHQWSF